MANEKYLEEAFKALDILEEDVFNVSGNDIEEVKSFIDSGEDLENTVEVIDPLATDEEEVQDSYIGKAILDCVICQSKIYKDPEEVVLSTSVDEEKLANIGEECPYCQSIDGFRVIGQVAEYCPNCENTEGTATNDIEDKKFDEKLTEDIDKDISVKDALNQVIAKFGNHKYSYELTGEPHSGSSYTKRFYAPNDYIALLSMKLHEAPTIQNIEDHGYKGSDILEYLKEYPTVDAFATYLDKNYMWSKDDFIVHIKNIDTGETLIIGSNDFDAYDYDEYDFDEYDFDESLKSKRGKKLKPVKEDLEKVSVETDSTVLTMEQAENGKVVVTTEPTEKAEEPKEEMIAEITPEVEAKFKDIEIDEFEEKDFDELGEKYLKRVYENVQAYKTVKGSTKGNRLTLEGLIEFKSGKKAKTHFVFEAKLITKTGKLKFIGENKQFAKGKRAFTLTGRANGTKLIAESLTYNYKAKDAKTGASKKLYGTVSKVRK